MSAIQKQPPSKSEQRSPCSTRQGLHSALQQRELATSVSNSHISHSKPHATARPELSSIKLERIPVRCTHSSHVSLCRDDMLLSFFILMFFTVSLGQNLHLTKNGCMHRYLAPLHWFKSLHCEKMRTVLQNYKPKGNCPHLLPDLHT